METLQIDILDPKAKEMLEEMVAQDLIEITGDEIYKLSDGEKKLVNLGMEDYLQGKVTDDSVIREEENSWLKE